MADDESVPPTAPTPVPVAGSLPLGRPALERVLARAAELQAGATDSSETMLSESQLVDVGREVGLDPQHILQALAEERSRPRMVAESGKVARVFGVAHAAASRTLRGTPERVLSSLDALMQREESLVVKRRFPDRILWEARPGLITEFSRLLNVGGRGYHLARAHEIAATAIPVDADRVLVRLDADLTNVRSQRVASGGAVVGGGAAVTAIALVLGLFPLVAAAPVVIAAAGGYAVARSHTPVIERAQLSLEQVLDRLERGDTPRPSLLSAIGSSARTIR